VGAHNNNNNNNASMRTTKNGLQMVKSSTYKQQNKLEKINILLEYVLRDVVSGIVVRQVFREQPVHALL
jgi:hypothetical protein